MNGNPDHKHNKALQDESSYEYNLVLEEKIKEIDAQMPSTGEIASLAAALMVGRPLEPEQITTAAKAAIELWETAAVEREGRIRFAAKTRLEINAIWSEVQKKALPKFPASREELLRRVMPKRSVQDREKRFLEWLIPYLRYENYWMNYRPKGIPLEQVPLPSEKELGAALEKHVQYDEAAYQSTFAALRAFEEEAKKKNLKHRATLGAKGLWSKKKKKPKGS